VDVSNPFEGLLPGVDTAVLVVLAGSSKGRTGREVARLARRSQPAVQEVLDRFSDQGLVHASFAGRSGAYTLNREHLAATAIEDLANLRNKLFGRLREEIAGWAVAPAHASVFGSAARGDGGPESDIDIFVVRPASKDEDDPVWRRQLDELGDRVLAWTGNHAGIAEVHEPDLVLWKEDEPAVAVEIKADAIELGGSPLRRILGRL
jgi:DNA-binding transcriptional ArsR family regulator